MMSGKELIEVGGTPLRISEIVQDLSGFKQIQEDALSIEGKIGEVNSISIYQSTSILGILALTLSTLSFFVFRTLSIVSTLNSYREDLD